MTPESLLDMLVSDLTVLLSDCLLPTKTGARRAPKVNKHDLPVPQLDDEDEDADTEDVTAPFVIVRATGGTFDDWSDLHHVGIAIIICTYDDTPDRQGTSDVLGVIERIYHRFARCPDLGNFRAEVPISWALQDETDTYPQYFGAMDMVFSCPGVRIEDPLT